MRRLWSCLRLALLDRLTDPDILAHIRVVKTLERVVPRFSPIAINGNVMSPKLIRIILSRRGLYSNRTWWSPGGNWTPTKLGISMTVSAFTPSTVARQFG